MNYKNRKIGVSILRVIIGILVLKDFISFYFNKQYLFSDKGIVSYETYLSIIKYYNINWLNINFNNEQYVIIYCIVGIFFSITFSIGIFKRISAILLFFLLFIFKIRNLYLLDGADNVISVILPFFIFIDSYSLSNLYETKSNILKTKLKPYVSITSYYFTLAVMIQICIIYFFASIHKLQGKPWCNGTALYYILNSDDFSASSLNSFLTKSIFFVKFFTWFTIIFQFLFPFLVWFKKSKKAILFTGIFFHIGIFFLMRIDNFSLIMIACYSVFFTNKEYLKTLIFLKNLKLKYAN